MLAYMHLVMHEAHKHGGHEWLTYDSVFWRNNQGVSTTWDITDPLHTLLARATTLVSLASTALRPTTTRKLCASTCSATDKTTPRTRSPCEQLNISHMQRQACLPLQPHPNAREGVYLMEPGPVCLPRHLPHLRQR